MFGDVQGEKGKYAAFTVWSRRISLFTKRPHLVGKACALNLTVRGNVQLSLTHFERWKCFCQPASLSPSKGGGRVVVTEGGGGGGWVESVCSTPALPCLPGGYSWSSVTGITLLHYEGSMLLGREKTLHDMNIKRRSPLNWPGGNRAKVTPKHLAWESMSCCVFCGHHSFQLRNKPNMLQAVHIWYHRTWNRVTSLAAARTAEGIWLDRVGGRCGG